MRPIKGPYSYTVNRSVPFSLLGYVHTTGFGTVLGADSTWNTPLIQCQKRIQFRIPLIAIAHTAEFSNTDLKSASQKKKNCLCIQNQW